MGPQSLYQEISDELKVTDEVQSSKMFGMPCLKIRGKAFAGFYQEHMIFKLRGNPLTETLALEGAKLFDPMGGRPMKEWVQLSYGHAGNWLDLAKQALVLQRELNG
ncbi:hypothetical protein [Paenibacillus sedimenti]|uniref:TfoX N-terminal domain-containing protein n=1 Tax=Paenibacillus sedimenti TaxID=2770274 RepID=A0A926KQF6_9BACL|nr:hypothetical protein [Paenibacillus sedimenti]MBD0381423.1 hypothetical protein [Paenibacillus sedimenti]